MTAKTCIGDNEAPAGETHIHHFCRRRATAAAALTMAVAAGLLVFAWVLLDATWTPPSPSGGTGGRGYVIVVALAALPVWIRVPLLISLAGQFIRVAIIRLRQVFDNEPDFVITPEGVGGWDGLVFRTIPWSEVSEVRVVDKNRPLFGPRILPRQQFIYVRGAAVGERPFFGTFPPRRASVLYTDLFFATSNHWILDALRRYRPDLVAEHR